MITPAPACRILHGMATPRCHARVDKYFVGYYALQFMEAGQVELFYDSQRHFLEKPGFWFCRPGPRIRFHPGAEGWWSHRYFAFTGPAPRQWARANLLAETPVACPPLRVPEFARRMDEIERWTKANDSLAAWQAANRLEGLLLEIAGLRASRGGTGSLWADRVGKAWRAAMHRPLDYAALAAAHGMALSTFRRRFRQETGVGPHQYVQKLRAAEARWRLERNQENQKEIAEALGYTDVYHFSHDFRRLAGMPPARYRASLLTRGELGTGG